MEKYSDSDITLRPLEISDGDYAVKWYMDEKVRLAANAVFMDWGHREAVVEVASQQVMEKGGFMRKSSDTGGGGGPAPTAVSSSISWFCEGRKYGFNKGDIRDMFIYSFLRNDQIGIKK
ncbi:uncharacterized protein LOC130991449 isoform X1 [Salvia miltiorrhiza]|uniref:uncharacterized protein LOC130991449 isoform X1 n=1 Tax=Salvia miltiorrhiza TaxID=226208 RepID=UPI0025AC86D9|nr:uncharacterized protein LOC130991449 isoform X1 [Salvia miltiorrhiza]